MQAIRLLFAQREFAVLICAAALLLKLLVPTGYMIGSDHGRLAIMVCPGTTPAAMPKAMPMAVMASGHAMMADGGVADHGDTAEHGRPELPCAFAGLSAAMTGAIDPVLLAVFIAFVMAVGLSGILLPAPFRPTYLRPPLRGPPAYL